MKKDIAIGMAALAIATALALPAEAQAEAPSNNAALAGCVEGAVMGTVALWTVAMLTALPTGGGSLAAAATLEATGGSAVLGCASGAAGRWVVHKLLGD